jgi:hypothetical protein
MSICFILCRKLFHTNCRVSDIATNHAQAETGKGKDIFKVIMTIFGVDKSKGDLVSPDFI